MKKNKKSGISSVYSINYITIVLCIISLALLIVTCINHYNMQRSYSDKLVEIDRRIVAITSSDIEDELENIYLEYYNQIDQKATDTINIVVAFFGTVFSLTTIVNTIVAVRIPKQFEDKMDDMDVKIKDIEKRAISIIASAMYTELTSSKSTTREKISAITEIIDEHGDETGDFYFLRGFLYDDIKDYEKAKNDYKQAKRNGGSDYAYHNSMGVLYNNIMLDSNKRIEKHNAVKKAEYHYNKAIKLREKQEGEASDFHCNLACLYQDYGKYLMNVDDNVDIQEAMKYLSSAMSEFNIAISANPENLTAYLNRGISYSEKGEKYYLDAYSDFIMCRKIDSDNKNALRELIDISLKLYERTGEFSYYEEAKRATSKLRQEINRLDALQRRIDVIGERVSKGLIAQIDERIGDLSVEEAKKYKPDTKEYSDGIVEAITHYQSAMAYYRETKSEEAREKINCITEKINLITDNSIISPPATN
ncbi:MAG: hypothetical protein E7284_02055 [Lachnospiraceae bacterium]|nr:hypothetical protein [Lachnospiraceae bacterium]